MRVILIRHAQSHNNVLSLISYDTYHDCRSDDPQITESGEKSAISVGKYMKHNEFKIDRCKSNDLIKNVFILLLYSVY